MSPQIHALQRRSSLRLDAVVQMKEGIALQRIGRLGEMVSGGSSLCCSLCAVD